MPLTRYFLPNGKTFYTNNNNNKMEDKSEESNDTLVAEYLTVAASFWRWGGMMQDGIRL